jgi:ribonuclease E
VARSAETGDTTSPAAFVETQPGTDTASAPQAEGEGRRRRRRGGRDRSENRGDDGVPMAADGVSTDAAGTAAALGGAPAADDTRPAASEGGAPESAMPEAGERDGAEREGGRRRGRGRDRDRPRRQDADAAGEGSNGAAPAGALDGMPSSAPAVYAAEYVAPEETRPAVAPVAAVVPVSAELPVSVPLPAPVSAAAPVRFTLPTEALTSLASAVGLEWVNSDAEKIRVVQEAMAREPKPIHVPREPKPVVLVDDGPLVLVETRKDLSQLQLPFEQGGAH